MTVTELSPHRFDHEGNRYYFCSASCKTKFSADPHGYLHKLTQAAPLQGEPAGTIYTCPMHPEIRRDQPGNCPICGMALEPLMPSLDEEENPELADFSRRFWWTLPLTIIIVTLAMAGHQLSRVDPALLSWLELAASTPLILWAGWPFLVRGVQSIANRSPNMCP